MKILELLENFSRRPTINNKKIFANEVKNFPKTVIFSYLS